MATNTTVLVYDLKTQKIYRVESANVLKHHVIVQDTSGQTTPTGQVILENINTENNDNADESKNTEIKTRRKDGKPEGDNQWWDVFDRFANPADETLIAENIAKEEKLEAERRKSSIENQRKNRLKKYGKRKQGGILRYPAELLTEHTDYLQIDIEKYAEIGKDYISDTGGSKRYVLGNRKTNRAGQTRRLTNRPLINDGTILLPIPSNVSDSNNVVYGDSRMNGLAAAGVSAVEKGLRDVGRFLSGADPNLIENLAGTSEEAATKIIKGLGGDTISALDTASDVMTKKLTAEAVNIFDANVSVNQLLARSNGEILNPNMELLFSDVTVRNFRFSFKMTPRNQKEAEQVKLIIRAFKRNMAPQAIGSSGEGNFFLRTPNVFKLRYRTGNRDHPFLNRFKQCFLSDMQTTYTGDGVYSTYDDGTPVSLQLDLSFKEIQPIYDLDYDEKPGTEAVGY